MNLPIDLRILVVSEYLPCPCLFPDNHDVVDPSTQPAAVLLRWNYPPFYGYDSPNDCTLSTLISHGWNIDSDGSCNLNLFPYDGTGGPGLGPLADNGRPIKTHALLPDSPSIGQSRIANDEGQAGFNLEPGNYKFKARYDGVSYWSPVMVAPGPVSIDIPE